MSQNCGRCWTAERGSRARGSRENMRGRRLLGKKIKGKYGSQDAERAGDCVGQNGSSLRQGWEKFDDVLV